MLSIASEHDKFLQHPVPEFKLIETLLWQRDRGFWLLELHMERLAASARYFDFAVHRDQVMQLLLARADHFKTSGHDSSAYRVRLTVDRDGDIEVADTPVHAPNRIDLITPVEGAAAPARNLPRVVLSPKKIDSGSRFLYHKTTFRKNYAGSILFFNKKISPPYFKRKQDV